MVKIKTTIDNLNINYINQGSGKTVLILPGWGTTINTYMNMINNLSQSYNVYCLDMPGFGESDEPDRSWNVDDFVDFIKKFIKKLGIDNVNLIGHSNGGRIIIKMLNQKLDFNIDKVVLIGSAGIVHKKTFTQKCRIYTFKFLKKLALFKPINKMFPKLIDKVKSKFGSADYKSASPVMRETLVKIINEDLRDILSNIDKSTLLIWGENDTATPIEDAKIMEKEIPDAGLICVKNCTHYVFLEQPNYVCKVINTFFG